MQCNELALIYEKEMQRGNPNRATLAVTRKIVACLLAVERRQQDFVPTEEFGGKAAASRTCLEIKKQSGLSAPAAKRIQVRIGIQTHGRLGEAFYEIHQCRR